MQQPTFAHTSYFEIFGPRVSADVSATKIHFLRLRLAYDSLNFETDTDTFYLLSVETVLYFHSVKI